MHLDDFTIRKTALAVSVLGIALLFLAAQLGEAARVEIPSVDDSMLGRKISLEGKVLLRHLSKNVLVFELGDAVGNRVKCVIFGPSDEERRAIANGSSVAVSGTVRNYEGGIEVAVERVGGID